MYGENRSNLFGELPQPPEQFSEGLAPVLDGIQLQATGIILPAEESL